MVIIKWSVFVGNTWRRCLPFIYCIMSGSLRIRDPQCILWLEPVTPRSRHCNLLLLLSTIWITLGNPIDIQFPNSLLHKALWSSNGPNLNVGPHSSQWWPTGSMVTSSNSKTCELIVFAFKICLTYLHKEHSKRRLIWRLILIMNIKEPCTNVHVFDHWNSLFTFKKAASNKINVLKEL